jgi:RNA polymerase sigma factor (TIGR02999 family)
MPADPCRAAAEAMRRILVDHARRKRADQRGGDARRFELSEADKVVIPDPDTLLVIDEALAKLAAEDPASADVARLRLFAGLSVDEAAEALGQSRATAYRDWAYARAWLTAALAGD